MYLIVTGMYKVKPVFINFLDPICSIQSANVASWKHGIEFPQLFRQIAGEEDNYFEKSHFSAPKMFCYDSWSYIEYNNSSKSILGYAFC